MDVERERSKSTTARCRWSRPQVPTWRERNVYDVFAPAGEYVGRTTLPERTRIIFIQRDRVWLLSKGVDDEDILMISRIQAPNLQ